MTCGIRYEVLGENPIHLKDDNGIFRLVIFEIDDKTGSRSITDIIEGPVNFLKSWLDSRAELDKADISNQHDDVDFGRAKKLSSRMEKVFNHLMEKENAFFE